MKALVFGFTGMLGSHWLGNYPRTASMSLKTTRRLDGSPSTIQFDIGKQSVAKVLDSAGQVD